MHPDLDPCGGEDQVPSNHDWVCCIACISPAPKRYRMIACHFLHLRQKLRGHLQCAPSARLIVTLHQYSVAHDAVLKIFAC